MKKCLGIMMVLCLMASLFTVNVGAASDVKVFVNGVKLGGAQPTIINGRTMVPLRSVFEALGFHVNWNDTTKTATIKAGSLKNQFTLNSKTFLSEGASMPLDVPVTLINGSVMVPVSYITNNLEAAVKWDGATKTVNINAEPITWEITTTPFDDGSVYVGETFDGLADGNGKLTQKDGQVYTGQFVDGAATGKGKLVTPVGVYEGSFLNAQKDGYGIYKISTIYVSGVYEGYFKNDKMHGQGKLTYADGTVEEGDWVNGELQTPVAQKPAPKAPAPVYVVGDTVTSGIFNFKGTVIEVNGTKALVRWYAYTGDKARFEEMKGMWKIDYGNEQWMNMSELMPPLPF